MNKEQLEKMFYEKFTGDDLYEVKQFIFETIIPEVLYNLIEDKNLDKMLYTTDVNFYDGYVQKIEDIKEKAKELYGITL